VNRKLQKFAWRATKATALFTVDAIGWVSLKIIYSGSGAPSRRQLKSNRGGLAFTPIVIPSVPEIPHCPRCSEILEEHRTHFECHGCDSAWRAAPDGNVIRGRAA
jgi:hypothetical protein